MARQYGKRINLHKEQNKPTSSQVSKINLKSLKSLLRNNNRSIKQGRYGRAGIANTFRISGTSSTDKFLWNDGGKSLSDMPSLSNPFYNYLQTACIGRLKIPQCSNTTGTTSLSITSAKLDNLIKKGDKFYLCNPSKFYFKELTCDADLLASDNSITITSTNFTTSDWFPAGSLLVADNQKAMQTTANAIEYKKFTLTNAQYKTLQSSIYTLLPPSAGKIHLPISCYIQYIHGGDEMTTADLYIGHNRSTIVGDYWGSIDRAFWRIRDNQLLQLGASTYGAGASGNFVAIPIKCRSTDGTGKALELYTTSNFTSAGSYIKVHLYYKTIVS